MRNQFITYSLVIFIITISTNVCAQVLEVKTILDKAVQETSGLICINGKVITHNDSGSKALLYEINSTTGEVVRTVTVNNAVNVDWEDICYDDSYIYIGDFGNNYGTRKDLKVYRILIDDYFETSNDEVDAETIHFAYADQSDFSKTKFSTNYDAEAIISCGDHLYLFTKDWGDLKSRVYALPKIPGTYTVNPLTTIDVQGLFTGASYNAAAHEIILIGYTFLGTDFMMEVHDFNPADLSKLGYKRYDLSKPDTTSTQIEGVTFVNNKDVLISAELYQGNSQVLYKLLK